MKRLELMKRVVYKSQFIKAVVGLLAILSIFLIWPLRILTEDVVISNPAKTEGSTGVINYLNSATQVFIATNNHLQGLRVWVKEGTVSDQFTITIHNTQNQLLAVQEVEVPQTLPGYAEILMDIDVVPGELYTLKFNSQKSLYLGEEPWYNPEAVAVSYYNTELNEGLCIVMDYEYRMKLGLSRSLFGIGLIVLIALVICALVDRFLRFKKQDGLITVERGMKFLLNPIVCIFVLGCYVCICLGMVSRHTPDKIFAGIGVTLLGAVLLYGINHSRNGIPSVLTVSYLKEHTADIIQSVAIAGAIQGCCIYVSALYDINHYVAERKTMLWFAFIIIAMFGIREIVNIYNLVYLAAAVIGGFLYYRRNLADGMTLDEVFVLRANIAITVLLGFILIRTIKVIIQKKPFARLNIGYCVVGGIFLAMTIIFRNTRWWTVTLAVAVVLLIINLGFWKSRANFITNVIRGAVLQFVLCTLWVLCHRPFVTFRNARYTHFFHTSTVTATYMTAMGCIATVLLLSKLWRLWLAQEDSGTKKPVLRHIWKELVFFGMVMTYLMLTMARTAYAAMCVALIGAVLIFTLGYLKKRQGVLKLSAQCVGWMIVAVLVMFPITFELQRTIPCLVSEPYEYDIDNFTEEVRRGRQLNSDEYMLVGRIANEFFSKILSKETRFDRYYNPDFVYDEYHTSFRQVYELTGYTWPGVIITDDMWETEIPDNCLKYGWMSREPESYYRDNYKGPMYEPSEEYLAQIAKQEAAEEELPIDSNQEKIASEEPAEIIMVMEEEPRDDYSNGRIDIFKDYIRELNLTGHPTMGFIGESGKQHEHAHDVYLQIAYDHGIPTAIAFVIFGVTSVALALAIFLKYRNEQPNKAVTLVVLIGFGVAGVVEWTYQLCHPMSFIVWLVVIPLVFETELIHPKKSDS